MSETSRTRPSRAVTLYRIIREQGLYKGDRTRLPVEDIIQNMRRKIYIRVLPAPRVPHVTPILVQCASDNPVSARRVTSALTSDMIAIVHGAVLLDPPSRHDQPTEPRLLILLPLGLAGGIVLAGATFAALRIIAGSRAS